MTIAVIVAISISMYKYVNYQVSEKTIIVYDINGDKITEYEGRFTNINYNKQSHEIHFDDEDGKSHSIYYDKCTVIIDEE